MEFEDFIANRTIIKAVLYDFLEQAQQDEVEAEQAFRAWVRQQVKQS